MALRIVLSLTAIGVYVVVGNLLAARAFKFHVHQGSPEAGYQIWYSKFFTIAGQQPRKVTVRFLIFGGLGLAGVLWLLNS